MYIGLRIRSRNDEEILAADCLKLRVCYVIYIYIRVNEEFTLACLPLNYYKGQCQ